MYDVSKLKSLGTKPINATYYRYARSVTVVIFHNVANK